MSANKLLVAMGVLAIALTGAMYIPVSSTPTTNYRPYISTTLAKIILQADNTVPDDVNPDEKELCDGSGWITHGDGHKTECPGCKACKNKVRPEKTCKCNTKSTYCDCVNQYGKCNCEARTVGSVRMGFIMRLLSRLK